ESRLTPQDLFAALRALDERWEARASEALAYAQQLRLNDAHQANYYRGLSEGSKAALADLRALLQQPSPTESDVPADYVPINPHPVMAVLDRGGLSIPDLHAHKHNTFSAIFAPLQVLSFDERIARLTSAADIAILDYGRLPNSNKAYIDFAFKSPPE